MPNEATGNTLKLWNKFEQEVSDPRWGVLFGWKQIFMLKQQALNKFGGPEILSTGPFVPGVENYLKTMREMAKGYDEVSYHRWGIRVHPGGKDFDIVQPSSQGEMQGIIPYLIAVGVVVIGGVLVYLERMKLERAKLEQLAREKNMEFSKYIMKLPPDQRSALKSTSEWIASNKLEKTVDSVTGIAASVGRTFLWFAGAFLILKMLPERK